MNPNETILIPLLNRRIAELVSQNIVFEAKNILLEQEKEALLQKTQELNEKIDKMESAYKKRSKKDGSTLDGSTY